MTNPDIRAQAEERREGKAFASWWLGLALAAIAAVIVVYFVMMFGRG